MLPSQHRLRAEKEIKKVFKLGRRITTPLLRFQILKNQMVESRFAIIVSTKVAKRAVARNLLKRRIREIIRKNLQKMSKGLDFIIQARSSSVSHATPKIKGKRTPHEIVADYNRLKMDIEECIQKINPDKTK